MARKMDKPKHVKLEIGTIYQKKAGGVYYFRYQVRGERKVVSLKTKNLEIAKDKAKDYLLVIQASTKAIIAAHVLEAKDLAKKQKDLRLTDIWNLFCLLRPRQSRHGQLLELAHSDNNFSITVIKLSPRDFIPTPQLIDQTLLCRRILHLFFPFFNHTSQYITISKKISFELILMKNQLTCQVVSKLKDSCPNQFIECS